MHRLRELVLLEQIAQPVTGPMRLLFECSQAASPGCVLISLSQYFAAAVQMVTLPLEIAAVTPGANRAKGKVW